MWGNRDDYHLSDSSENISFEKTKTFDLQDKQDGLLELAGVYNSLHLGECQVGVSSALKIAQGKKFELEVIGNERVIFQIDGEPSVVKGPLTIEIRRKDQVKILTRATERYHYVAKKAVDVIGWAKDKGIINNQQKEVILNEFSRRSKV